MAMTEERAEWLRRRFAVLMRASADEVAEIAAMDPDYLDEAVAEMEEQLRFYASIGTPADVPEPEPEPAA